MHSVYMADSKECNQSISKWSSQVYKLADFLDRFSLPQIIKVYEGYLDESEENTLSVDDVLLLLRFETTQKVCAISSLGGEVSVPLIWGERVDRVSEEYAAKSSLSSRDVLHQLSKVKFVRVVENDTEAGLTRNQKLKVKYKTVQNHGTSFSFILSTLTKPKKVFKVTQDCKATFQVVLDQNEYLIANVVRKFGLPSFVWLVNNPIQSKFSNSFEAKQRVLRLQSTFTETFIIASTLTDSTSSLIKLPKNLEVTVCSSLGAENKDKSYSELCGLLSKNTNLGSDLNVMSERADASFVYEDMAYLGKESEIASLETSRIKREIKKDPMGNIRGYIPNTYTATPLVKAISNRNTVYDIPRLLTTESGSTLCLQSRDSESLYDTPRPRTQSTHVNERDSSGGSFSQVCSQEYAHIDRCTCSRGSSSSFSSSPSAMALDHEFEDHIYQEIVFRELPIEMKDRCLGEPMLKSNESIIAREIGEFSSNHEKGTFAGNHIIGELKTEPIQNSNTYQVERRMTDKAGKSARKAKERNLPTESHRTALYENISHQEGRLSDSRCASDYASCKQDKNNISPQERPNSSGCLLGDAINDALLKNKLFVSKADNTGAKIPPAPPPRTSSRRPEVPIMEGCSIETTSTPSKTRMSQPSLPEPRKGVRRSVSAVGLTCSGKEKNKFASRPLPIPKARSQSLNSTEVVDVKPRMSTSGPTLKTCAEKVIRPKPIVPRKTVGLSQTRTRCDGSEEQSFLPASHVREKKTSSVELRNSANPHRPKNHGLTRTKPGNELVAELNKKTSSTPRENRSHSLNNLERLGTQFVIPDDLRSLGVSGVTECLKRIKMDHLVEFFEANQIDGEMLLSLDDDIMSEMGIEKFHRLKLIKFIGGWRPMM